MTPQEKMYQSITKIHEDYEQALFLANEEIRKEEESQGREAPMTSEEVFALENGRLVKAYANRTDVHKKLVSNFWACFQGHGILPLASEFDYQEMSKVKGKIEIAELLRDAEKICGDSMEKTAMNQLEAFVNLKARKIQAKVGRKHITLENCLNYIPAFWNNEGKFLVISGEEYMNFLQMLAYFCHREIVRSFNIISDNLPQSSQIGVGKAYELPEDWPIKSVTFFANKKQKIIFDREESLEEFMEMMRINS